MGVCVYAVLGMQYHFCIGFNRAGVRFQPRKNDSIESLFVLIATAVFSDGLI